MLGGSTEINGGFYVRGNAKDYDLWAELGNVGWSYEDILPYFKKSEYANFTEEVDSFYHGFRGLQSIDFPPEISNLVKLLKKKLSHIIKLWFCYLDIRTISWFTGSWTNGSRLQRSKSTRIRKNSNLSSIQQTCQYKLQFHKTYKK